MLGSYCIFIEKGATCSKPLRNIEHHQWYNVNSLMHGKTDEKYLNIALFILKYLSTLYIACLYWALQAAF
jgi:hypothetical protein